MARNKLSVKTGHRPPKRLNAPLITLAMGIFILAIIAILAIYFQRSGNKTTDDKIQAINIRLAQINERLSTIEEAEKSMSLIDEQRTKFEISLMNRIDGLEALINLRQGTDTEAPDSLHRVAVVQKSIPEEESEKDSGKEADIHYHQVQPGETLYRISLKYGISVDGLRKLNNIGPEAIIYVGQKLKVGGM
jgi:LysM repeat protein